MNVEGATRGRKRAWQVLLAAAVLAGASGGSAAGDLFKCGKVFQDRPCESTDVQQRFSRTQGTFAIEQVNPDTDKDCAHLAADAMVWWRRMAAGEPMEKLNAELQAQNIARDRKSLLRDVLIAVKNTTGTEREVRSQYETQCMAYKRRNGYATEKDLAAARSPDPRVVADENEAARRALMQSQADARRAEIDARRAEMEARAAEARARAAAARRRQPY
jgi:hypothetical protein